MVVVDRLPSALYNRGVVRRLSEGTPLRPVRPAILLVVCLSPLVALGCGPSRPIPAASAGHDEPLVRPGFFEDVTQRAGIRFTHTNGSDLRYPLLQTMGGGCAFLDYDSDGYPDVLLLSCGEF